MFTNVGVSLLLLLVAPDQDRLWHLRNLGKAFYENPTTQKEAVEEFRQALELNPNSVRERVNYGLALLKNGDTKPAVVELEKAQKQDPSIPHTWFNLGIVSKREGNYPRAIEEMRQMIKLVPEEPTAHHNLATLYKLTGQVDDAIKEFEIAEKLNPDLAAPHFQLYTAYRQSGRAADAARELGLFQQVKKRQEGAPIAENMEANNYSEIYETLEPKSVIDTAVTFKDQLLARNIKGIASSGTDILAWSADGVSVFRHGTLLVEHSGLEKLAGVVSISAGDYDNDGKLDLCVIAAQGASLWHNDGTTYSKSSIQLPSGDFRKAVWIDYDHDYDLDLILLGPKSVLYRNQGSEFTDQTASFPFVEGEALDGTVFSTKVELPARDLVVSYRDHAGIRYRDALNGRFEATPLPGVAAGTTALAAFDFNCDGVFDLAVRDSQGFGVLLGSNDALTRVALPEETAGAATFALGRYIKADLPTMVAAVGSDWNFGGLLSDGTLRFFNNQTTPQSSWTRVAITGIKNLKTAEGAVVEVKSGALYQRALYHGAPLLFPVSGYKQVDTVRITWPNGLIQNEPQQAVIKDLVFPEAQRLSGSCPMIFTWDGEEFQFITDVLGVAPLGASSADGSYFPVDHDEYVQIPGSALKERDGTFEIRVTEELREVSYLDKIQLIALDHPDAQEIFTNDKFKSPPFPEFRLFGVTQRLYPITAIDNEGQDILPALKKRDSVYPNNFDRTYTGIAKEHWIDLDFGDVASDGRTVLILNGWVDWADGSTFLGASQSKGGELTFPYLQVQDQADHWKTVIEDMGIPAGKPKTISVDLSGKWLSSSRKVRIITNLCVYWDEIFLSELEGSPQVRLTPISASSADVHFRGFSHPVIDPKRQQPEKFEYARIMTISQWNPTKGLYTRYGDVRSLVTDIDDKLLIMGSGDEVRLLYPSANLPPLPPGWSRDFLLSVDGWAKDADANTAYSQSVTPLPFHEMSAYPYKPSEHFPDDKAHCDYLRKYNTRPALKLVRPLNDKYGSTD